MIKFKDARLLFPRDISDEAIAARFEQRFGHKPENIERDERGAWAGPITAEEEQTMRTRITA